MRRSDTLTRKPVVGCGRAVGPDRREADRVVDTFGNDGEDRVAAAFEHHGPRVAAYALRRTSTADAADVVADTFLVAWRRRDDMPAEPQTLPWLYGVARGVLANQRRSHRRRSRLRSKLAIEFAGHAVDPPDFDGGERFTRVARALDTLPAADAEILRLIAWEGLSPGEVATVMDLAPGTARQRIHRARKRLRNQLAADPQQLATVPDHPNRDVSPGGER